SSNILIPIRIAAGQGQATVADIPCEPAGTRTVLTATTQAGIAHYGATPGSTLPLATIDVPLLPDIQLSARGSYPIASGGPTDFSFTQSDIDSVPPQVKEMSSDVSVISGLANALEVQPDILNGVLDSLLTVVSEVLGALDPVLNSLLRTLGVKLGGLDMIVHGVRCNAPVLVL
ncbi:MAG: hypothetical protein Q7U42_14900, partial [Parvibaculum sp.]|nr:hypothetical protein [Parvibaculum sp.]